MRPGLWVPAFAGTTQREWSLRELNSTFPDLIPMVAQPNRMAAPARQQLKNFNRGIGVRQSSVIDAKALSELVNDVEFAAA